MLRPPLANVPATLILRDALRIARHVALEGRAIIARGSDQAGAPLQQIAGATLSGIDHLAQQAARVAHSLLDDATPRDPLGETRDVKAFANAAHAVLGPIMQQLGATGWLLSEVKLALAFEAARGDPAGAGALVAAMQDLGVIADTRMRDDAALSADEAARLAPFALMLWMLAEKSPRDCAPALSAATALTLALQDDILAAPDAPARSALLAKFRHHV